MKIGMIFPGYGNQFVGMAKELYDEQRIIQEYFEEAYNCSNINYIKLCFASSDSELSNITNAYSSIYLVSCALSSLLKEHGIKPDLVAGYGIGYYAAAYAAGGLTFPDGLYLLKKFSTYFEEALPSLNANMLKVDNLSTTKLKKICSEFKSLQISSFINDELNLVSGNSSEIEELKACLKEIKIKSQILEPSYGLQSDLMNNIVEQYQIYLGKVDFKDTQLPIINYTDAKEINLGKKIKDNIIKQISLPIKWNKVIEKFADLDLIILVGPGSMFIDDLKQKYADKKIVSFNSKADLEEIKQILASSQPINEIKEENVQQQQQ